MKIIYLSGPTKLSLKRTCVAIGIFDGVHRGHQYLIRQMLKRAGRLKLRPLVITFFPHPAHVLSSGISLEYITSLKDRLRWLERLGVEAFLVVKFNKSFARMPPQQFISDILIKKLDARAVFVGANFRFGKDRSGGVELFERLAGPYGYEMHAVAPLKQGGEAISSTRIRRSIAEGKLAQAGRLLGRPVSAGGRVVQGSRRGKKLGFPTANVAYEADLLPPRGVYAARVHLGKKEYQAAANIGRRPSFENNAQHLILEVHIFDFSGNIYGRHVEVEFLKKIRNEKKFPSPQHLIRQIQKDEAFARKYFKALR
ncbi:MAG: bifunctional riboflavin kinase/FAD synthetase [Candidatus Omnitrophica bacterium]|nr:bifunctional riboflavin kinase/FAD synthetase [Candidatus Omnitrophota bacterium]